MCETCQANFDTMSSSSGRVTAKWHCKECGPMEFHKDANLRPGFLADIDWMGLAPVVAIVGFFVTVIACAIWGHK